MSEKQEALKIIMNQMETIDQILLNLRKDRNHYNHGLSEEEFMRLERMEDEL